MKPGTQPIFVPQNGQKPILEEHIEKLIKEDIVESTTSRWNSPVILVPKHRNEKGESWLRLVFDYRKLNEVTETQLFPMPDLEDEIAKMNGSKYFSTMDLDSAFHQILLAPEDKELTSFQTTTRKLQFKRMPFGLKGSPITWQRMINMVLDELLQKNNMAYMDDIISYNKTLLEHLKNLIKILERLRMYNLKLKVEKTKFLCKQVKYLGFIINQHGINTNPEKVDCINKFERPDSIVKVQSFLGAANYYRKHVMNYSKIARPLYDLCKKDIPFIWSSACEDSFLELKKALITAPILAFPNFKEVFYVTTDSSDYACGAVLSQGTPPFDRPICTIFF